MPDQMIAVTPQDNDIHRSVYSSLIGTGQKRDFIYSRVPVKTQSGEVVVSVRRPGATIAPALYGFALVASPQVRGSTGKKIVPNNLAAVEWLKRQFTENGAEADDVEVLSRGRHVAESQQIPFIEFGGTVRVTDTEKFSAWYSRGAGKARAYGYGMITLTLPLTETN